MIKHSALLLGLLVLCSLGLFHFNEWLHRGSSYQKINIHNVDEARRDTLFFETQGRAVSSYQIKIKGYIEGGPAVFAGHTLSEGEIDLLLFAPNTKESFYVIDYKPLFPTMGKLEIQTRVYLN